VSDTTTTGGTPTPPARRRGPIVLFLAVLLGAALGGGAVLLAGRAGGDGARADHAADPAPAKPLYQCPMHPSVTADHPSDCPICGMKLVKVEAPATAPAAGSAPAAAQWTCPMHPTIVQDHPGDCPICGMKLVKTEAAAAGGHADHGPSPEGLAAVTIEPSRQQLIGLRTTKVAEGEVGGAWRTAGRVAIDETRVHHVNVKVGGFIEHDHATFIGKMVKKGEPLFAIYSPELLSAQQEYLLALRTRGELAGAGAARDGDNLVAAARRKLELWDVPAQELTRLERTGEATKTLMFYSPATGVVTKRDVVPGMRVEAGAMPYEIVDLSRLWVLADVYESELRHVRVGLPATLTLRAYPGKKFQGRVAFIDPILDPKSRTAKVRLEFANASGELKPEMFGEVVLEGPKRRGLVVPADAVIDSGTMQVVFVAVGGGTFQPREVKLGDGDGRHVEVLEGVHAGEEVVTGANFLVDSESRLRASLAAMTGGAAKAPPKAAATGATGGAAGAAADPHAGHGGR
jgi:membrane fusion protein, copper/silver efflux system